MVALGLGSVIAAHRVLVGGRIDHRGFIVGVARAGGGQFGQHGLDGGPQLRGDQPAQA